MRKTPTPSHAYVSAPTSTKVGRNDLCPCGSGKKFKKCCLGKEEREKREQAAIDARWNTKVWFPSADDLQLPDVPESLRSEARLVLGPALSIMRQWRVGVKARDCWHIAQTLTLSANGSLGYVEGVWNRSPRNVWYDPADLDPAVPHGWNSYQGHIVDLVAEFYGWKTFGEDGLWLHEQLKEYTFDDLRHFQKEYGDLNGYNISEVIYFEDCGEHFAHVDFGIADPDLQDDEFLFKHAKERLLARLNAMREPAPAALSSASAMPQQAEEQARLDRQWEQADSATKLKATNDAMYEVMVKQAREEDPVGFEHKNRYCAYHEAGHALLNMLLYGNLRYVSIVPFFDSWEDVERMEAAAKAGQGWNGSGGVCVAIHHDVEGMDDDDRLLFPFEQIAILLAGKTGGDVLCTCDVHIGSDAVDQEAVNAATAKAKPGVKDMLVSVVATVIQRYRVQLEAIANALVERETLSGDEVMDVMLSSGWDPDAEPDEFRREFVLALRAEKEAEQSVSSASAPPIVAGHAETNAMSEVQP